MKFLNEIVKQVVLRWLVNDGLVTLGLKKHNVKNIISSRTFSPNFSSLNGNVIIVREKQIEVHECQMEREGSHLVRLFDSVDSFLRFYLGKSISDDVTIKTMEYVKMNIHPSNLGGDNEEIFRFTVRQIFEKSAVFQQYFDVRLEAFLHSKRVKRLSAFVLI